jgi:hypothetical protein
MNIRGATKEELKSLIRSDINILGDRQKVLSFLLLQMEVEDASYTVDQILGALEAFIKEKVRAQLNREEESCINKYIKFLRGWY